jgi:transposase
MKPPNKADEKPTLTIFYVPCSCGTNIAVREGEETGPHGRRLQCPTCGKQHDRHYRALRFEYDNTRYWRSGGC